MCRITYDLFVWHENLLALIHTTCTLSTSQRWHLVDSVCAVSSPYSKIITMQLMSCIFIFEHKFCSPISGTKVHACNFHKPGRKFWCFITRRKIKVFDNTCISKNAAWWARGSCEGAGNAERATTFAPKAPNFPATRISIISAVSTLIDRALLF